MRGGLAVTVLVGLLLATWPEGTSGATWTDRASVTGGTLRAHTVAGQAQPTCREVGSGVQLTWAQDDVRHEYAWVRRRTADGQVAAQGVVGTGTPAGGTVTLTVPAPALIAGGRNFDVVVRARVVGYPSWQAAGSTSTPVRHDSLVVIGLVTRCGHS